MGHREQRTRLVWTRSRASLASLGVVLLLMLNYVSLSSAAPAPLPIAVHPLGHPLTPAQASAAALNSAQASLARGAGPAAHLSAASCPTSSSGRSTCAPRFVPGPPPTSPGPWLNITTLSAIGPGSRACYAMAYDASDGYVVLFSGCIPSGMDGQTWTYSQGVWTQLKPVTSPSNRTLAMMTYDSVDGYVLLFGGQVSGGSVVGDTWEFHAGAWTKLTPSTSPSPREGAGFAYDTADGYAVLFGGVNPYNFADYNDTWTFTGGVWTIHKYANKTAHPTPRHLVSMAYDPTNKSVVLFGGEDTALGKFPTDTWTFAKGNWTHVNATITPSGRESSAMVYDPVMGHVLLLGGDNGGVSLKDMWAWLGTNWTQVNSTPSPSKRTTMSMVWDTADGYGLLFGGSPTYFSRSYMLDTWTLGLNLTASISVSPSNIDLGEATTFRAAAVGNLSNFTFSYKNLPTGCTGGNVTSITCTPTVGPTSYTVELTVKDEVGRTVYANTTITIWSGPQISSFVLTPSAMTLGQTLNFSTTAAGGVGVLKYLYLGFPGFPSGCSTHNLSTFTCVPRAKGVFTMNVTVTDSLGGKNNATANLVINADPAVNSFGAALSQIDLTQAVNFQVNATGGTGGLTYNYSGLPQGCSSMNSPTLTCTPTQLGTFNVTVFIADAVGYNASRLTSITINPDPVISAYKISPSSIDLGQATSFLVNASGGTGTLSYSYAGLPKGCSSANVSFFSCAPTVTGNFTVNVTVVDLSAYTLVSAASFLVRGDPAVASFRAAPAQLDIGQALVLTANVTGGTAPFSYSYSGLPLGCLVADSAVLNCTPTVTGAFIVHLTVHDKTGRSVTATTSLSIQADLSLIAFTISPAIESQGTNTTFTVAVRGGTGARTFSYSGLPAGCNSANTSSLSCVPTQAGAFTVEVQVTDAAQYLVSANASLTVNATSTTPGGGPKSSGTGGLSTTDWAIIGLAIAIVVIIAGVVLTRRRPSSGGGPDPSEADSGDEGFGDTEAPAEEGEQIYGSAAPAEAEPEPEPELVTESPQFEEGPPSEDSG